MAGPAGQQRWARWAAWTIVFGLLSLFAVAALRKHAAAPGNAPPSALPSLPPSPTVASATPTAALTPTASPDLLEEHAHLTSKPKSAAGHAAKFNCAPGDPTCLGELSAEPDLVDQALEHLRQAALAFNAPRSMALDDVVSVELLLSPAHSGAQLEQLIVLPGEKHSAPVRASNRMEARLLGGEAFDVTAATPEEQAISATEPTEWRWSVKPKHGGESTLTLNVTAIFPLEGSSARRSLKVFEQKIEVRVSAGQRVAAFFGNNWQWLWTTVLAPLGLWLWAKRRGAQEPAAAGSHAK